MKKFDLESFSQAKDIVTKNGKPVKVLYTKRDNDTFPIVAIIDNKQVACYTIEGKFYADKDSKNDLFFK